MVVRDLSMAPTFLDGDRLLVDPGAYRRRRPGRGEVVVLRDPEDRRRLLIKRVAAVAGDPTPPPVPPGDEETVAPGHVYVLSDRREGTRDSRRFGAVPLALLVGLVWFRYRPADRRGPVGT